MIVLRASCEADAAALFPCIYQTAVTDTIGWDGPNSLDEYAAVLRVRGEATAGGEMHFFTIVELASQLPVGTIDIRPDNPWRANIGLWLAAARHGRGYGTEAVRQITEYGFGRLELVRIEASVYVGNTASRRVFEKNGFALEGVLRKAALKRGAYLDLWMLAITRAEWHPEGAIG